MMALPGMSSTAAKKLPWDVENPKWREEFEATILESSNAMRLKHHSPPLTVKPEISKIAQDWANHLAKINKTVHRPDNVYGENIFYKWHKKHLITGAEVTQSFYNEIKYYYPYFQKEPNLEHFHRFGHFSQLLWRETEQCGTGIAVNGDKIFIVINYHPRGNWPDEYAANVLPAIIPSSTRMTLIASNPHPDHHNYIPPAHRGKVLEGEWDVSMVIPLVTTPILPAPGSETASTIDVPNTTDAKENSELTKEQETPKEYPQEVSEPVKDIPKVPAKETVKLPKEMLPKVKSRMKDRKVFAKNIVVKDLYKSAKEAPPETKEPEVGKDGTESPKDVLKNPKESAKNPKEIVPKTIINNVRKPFPKQVGLKDLNKTVKDSLKEVKSQPKDTPESEAGKENTELPKEISKNPKDSLKNPKEFPPKTVINKDRKVFPKVVTKDLYKTAKESPNSGTPETPKQESVKESAEKSAKESSFKTLAPTSVSGSKTLRKAVARPQFSAAVNTGKVRTKSKSGSKSITGRKPLNMPNIPGVSPVGTVPVRGNIPVNKTLSCLPDNCDFDKTIMAGVGPLQSIRARPKSFIVNAKQTPVKAKFPGVVKRPTKSATRKSGVLKAVPKAPGSVPAPALAPTSTPVKPVPQNSVSVSASAPASAPVRQAQPQKVRPIQVAPRPVKVVPVKVVVPVVDQATAEPEVPIVEAEVAAGNEGNEAVVQVGDESTKAVK